MEWKMETSSLLADSDSFPADNQSVHTVGMTFRVGDSPGLV